MEAAVAAHLDMRRPMTLPMAIGLNLREVQVGLSSPSSFKAMRRPPRNQGRTVPAEHPLERHLV